ncbi:nitronate monooxygenase [Microbacterium barkeri]
MSDARLLRSRLPIVAAPMAGGPSNVPLARAVSGAGAFPFLAGGYKTATALADEIAEVRELGVDYGVNLFVPSTDLVDERAFAAYAEELRTEADAYGLQFELAPLSDDDRWDEKLHLLHTQPVPVVSLTFGLPDAADIRALQDVGTRVLASVTTPYEARLAEGAGANGLVVQGPRAGGHSATFDATRTLDDIPTTDLVREVRAVTDLPLIAAGGVDGPAAVRDLLDAGAEGVAVGTLLLRSDEAGTSPTHKDALGDPAYTDTVLTRAFTGRPARALRNGFIDRHQETGLNAYPAVHHLTRALRQAASKAGDADRLHLWAGTGWRNATPRPAADIIRHLAEGL